MLNFKFWYFINIRNHTHPPNVSQNDLSRALPWMDHEEISLQQNLNDLEKLQEELSRADLNNLETEDDSMDRNEPHYQISKESLDEINSIMYSKI